MDTSPNFYLFTSINTLVIWPIKQDNKLGIEKKKRMIDVMVQLGKQAFRGAEGNFVKNTGQFNRGMAIIPGTHAPYISLLPPARRKNLLNSNHYERRSPTLSQDLPFQLLHAICGLATGMIFSGMTIGVPGMVTSSTTPNIHINASLPSSAVLRPTPISAS